MQVYRMAEINIGVTSLFDRVHRRCAAYAVTGDPDFTVSITSADIDREREQSVREAQRTGRPSRTWSDGYLEELAVYRQIAERMPRYDTILLHGAAVAVDGRGYLFAAPSGTGKSTHARLWQEMLGDRLIYVNDDKPLVRVAPEGAMVYGTPYDGKHRRSANLAVPLAAICFLQRGEKNVIRRIGPREAFPRLLQRVYRPQDQQALERTVALVQGLTERVGLFELTCDREPDAARVAFEGMGGTLI